MTNAPPGIHTMPCGVSLEADPLPVISPLSATSRDRLGTWLQQDLAGGIIAARCSVAAGTGTVPDWGVSTGSETLGTAETAIVIATKVTMGRCAPSTIFMCQPWSVANGTRRKRHASQESIARCLRDVQRLPTDPANVAATKGVTQLVAVGRDSGLGWRRECGRSGLVSGK